MKPRVKLEEGEAVEGPLGWGQRGQVVMEWACSPSATKPVSSLINYGNNTPLSLGGDWRKGAHEEGEAGK